MTMNKKIVTTLTLVMAVGVIGTAYAATTFFGEDCNIYNQDRMNGKACNDINDLNDRVTVLESFVPLESFLVLTPTVAQGDENIQLTGMIEYDGYDRVADMILLSPSGLEYYYNQVTVYENSTLHYADIRPHSFGVVAGDGYWEVVVDYNGEYAFGGFNYTRIP